MADRFGRRPFLLTGVAAAAGALAGTGSLRAGPAGATVPASGKTNGPGRNGIPTTRPRRGGTLVYGTDSEVQGFNNTANQWDENGFNYAKTVFDPFLAVTTTGRLVPYLAESVTPNADFTTWTVTLRPDLVFHDGTPCDGAAFYSNIETVANSILAKAVFSQFVKDATQTGPLSVRLDMHGPWAAFPYYLSSASQIGYMLAPSMLANPNGAEHPIGTGPFVYTAWVPNTHFTAVRNQHYWRKGLPHLDSVTYKPIVDPTSAAEALQLGSVDMINTNTASIIKEYRGNRQWSYVDNSLDVVGEPTVDCILLNCAAPPFSDRNARLAMAKAYTQAAICRTFGLEVNTPVTSPFPPGTQYHEKTTYPGYDPAGARAAVEAYEHAHGQTPSFTLRCPPDPQTQRVMTYLQQRYQDVGMTVSLSSVAQNTMIEDVAFGTFQAVAWRQFGAVDPDANYVFWAADTVEGSGISLNFARNKDPRIQRALTSARQSDSPAARTAAYRSIGEYLAQDLPYTWLGRSVWAVVANPKVQNFNNPQAPDGSAIIGLSGGSTWPTSVWIGS